MIPIARKAEKAPCCHVSLFQVSCSYQSPILANRRETEGGFWGSRSGTHNRIPIQEEKKSSKKGRDDDDDKLQQQQEQLQDQQQHSIVEEARALLAMIAEGARDERTEEIFRAAHKDEGSSNLPSPLMARRRGARGGEVRCGG